MNERNTQPLKLPPELERKRRELEQRGARLQVESTQYSADADVFMAELRAWRESMGVTAKRPRVIDLWWVALVVGTLVGKFVL
jgi:hypothetical protein